MSGEAPRQASDGLFDPFEPFRTMRDAYLENAAAVMVKFVNTEAYAQTTGAMLDAYLTFTAPFRVAMERTMSQALAQWGMPSRQEVASLSERCTHLEMKLDDIDMKLEELVRALRAERGSLRPA